MPVDLLEADECIRENINASQVVLQSHHADWRPADSVAVFATLFGAVAALTECLRLVADHRERHGRDARQASWDDLKLLEDFALATTNDALDWSRTPNLCVWSLGFFLNKAKQNIAAAFDIAINVWLSWRAGSRPLRLGPADDHAFYFGPYLRLRLVEALATNADARTSARTARSGFDDLYDDVRATAALDAFANDLLGVGQQHMLHTLRDLVPQPEKCLAITIGRVNAFKHRPAGNLHRMGAIVVPETMVVARAVRCATEFAGFMLDDTRGIWNSDRGVL